MDSLQWRCETRTAEQNRDSKHKTAFPLVILWPTSVGAASKKVWRVTSVWETTSGYCAPPPFYGKIKGKYWQKRVKSLRIPTFQSPIDSKVWLHFYHIYWKAQIYLMLSLQMGQISWIITLRDWCFTVWGSHQKWPFSATIVITTLCITSQNLLQLKLCILWPPSPIPSTQKPPTPPRHNHQSPLCLKYTCYIFLLWMFL